MQAMVSDLIGVTMASVEQPNKYDIVFTATDGRKWGLIGPKNFWNYAEIEDIDGELSDLVGYPIVQSEESESGKWANPERSDADWDYEDSATWVFYKFATQKGYVTIRYWGASNGYYSERAEFVEWNAELGMFPDV